jgi:hypothetical protein
MTWVELSQFSSSENLIFQSHQYQLIPHSENSHNCSLAAHFKSTKYLFFKNRPGCSYINIKLHICYSKKVTKDKESISMMKKKLQEDTIIPICVHLKPSFKISEMGIEGI